jgi:muramoyltetrapeptide carboxypeptidase LdcA involved in peptidoglycan recycling
MPTAFSYPEKPRRGDPDIKAIIASIGGEDELKVLAHLDPDLLAASPKPFFGYSENTNLHLFLWNLGLVSYLGGSIMVQFGWPVAMHPVSRQSLERAMGVPLVFGTDFGHTEPQHVIPSGGTVTVDGEAQQIYVTY